VGLRGRVGALGCWKESEEVRFGIEVVRGWGGEEVIDERRGSEWSFGWGV